MSFNAVTIINGEAYDGLINEIEPDEVSTVEANLVRSPFKAEMNMRTGEMKGLNKMQVAAGDLRLSDSGILKTATNNGFPVRDLDSINDKTIVSFNGVEMSARSASQLGLLSRDHDGRYSEKKLDGNLSFDADISSTDTSYDQVPSSPVTTDEALQKEAKAPEYNSELLDPDVETALDAISSDLGGYGALDRHAASVVGGLVNGDIMNSAKTLATNIGAEPGEAAAFINDVADRFRAKAVDYISKAHGVDGEVVIDWIAANIPAGERTSMAYQVYLGQTVTLDAMAKRFKGLKSK